MATPTRKPPVPSKPPNLKSSTHPPRSQPPPTKPKPFKLKPTPIPSTDEDQPGGQGECHGQDQHLKVWAVAGQSAISSSEAASATGETVEMKKPHSEHERHSSKQTLTALVIKPFEVCKDNIRDLYSVVKKDGIMKLPEKILTELFPQTGIRKGDQPEASVMRSPQNDFKPDFDSSVEVSEFIPTFKRLSFIIQVRANAPGCRYMDRGRLVLQCLNGNDYCNNMASVPEKLAILDCLLELTGKYGLTTDVTQLLQTWEQLVEKEVLISVFGRYNAGKSTLLNALLTTRFLPVKKESETGVKVMIKHSESVHRGPCPEQTHGGKACRVCPYLVSSTCTQDEVVTYKGTEDIKKALTHFNQEGREEAVHTADHVYKVYANVPAISGAPDPWNVYLVDNPGCGDVHQGLSNLAETAMKSSSAYVYIVHYKELGSTNDVESFNHIHAKDSRVFRDQRLVIAVTHFDIFYTSRRSHDKIPADEIKQKVCSLIKSAIGEMFPPEMVIPVCSSWAQWARQLQYNPKDEKVKASALKFLGLYDEGPRGQAESIESLDPICIAERLEKASGILQLEERIQGMSKSCLDIWVKTIENGCARYTREGVESLRAEIEKLETERNESQKEYDELERIRAEVEKHHQELKRTIEKPKTSTTVYQELLAVYPDDEKIALSQGVGKAEKLISKFKETTSEKIKRQSYMADEFEKDLSECLDEITIQLQKIYGNAHFSKMHQKYADQLMDMGGKFGTMTVNAERFCGIKHSSESTRCERQQEEERTLRDVIREHPPKLNDIKVKVEPVLSKWTKLWTWIREHFGQKDLPQPLSESDLGKPLDELRAQVKKACEEYFVDIRKYVVKHFYKLYAARTKGKLEDYDSSFKEKIGARKSYIKKLQSSIQERVQRIGTLSSWCKHLGELEMHMHKKAVEFQQAQLQT